MGKKIIGLSSVLPSEFTIFSTSWLQTHQGVFNKNNHKHQHSELKFSVKFTLLITDVTM